MADSTGADRAGFFTVTDTVNDPAHDALVERKSEFIGDVCHVSNAEEALAFVERIREAHPKARHVCYAAVTGAAIGRASERMSDDGEPSGTAGKPILEVLQMGRLTDCVITVTRYFGGVLLGSGGLIRAYSTAASMALKNAHIVPIVPKERYAVTIEYAWLGKFERIVENVGGECTDRAFTDKVVLHVVVPASVAKAFESQVTEAFSARARVLAQGRA